MWGKVPDYLLLLFRLKQMETVVERIFLARDENLKKENE